MKQSMRILTAIMVLAMAGWATEQTKQNQGKDFKMGRVMEIREVSDIQNPGVLNKVDEQQDKKVQLYRAADEVVGVSVKSGPDETIYTLTLSNGDEKEIPVEQLAASPLVRSIMDLDELKEFDDLRTVNELKMTDGLKIISQVGKQEKGAPVLYITEPDVGGTYKVPAGQANVKVFVFGKDSEEKSFSVGCTVEPDHIYIEKIPVAEKVVDGIVITMDNEQGDKPQQSKSKILRTIDELYDEIEATHARQHELMDLQKEAEAENRDVDEDVVRQLEELEEKYQQLWQKLRTLRDTGAGWELAEREEQLVELKAQLDALEDAEASPEKMTAVKNEIKQVEEIITELQDYKEARQRREEARQEENKLVEALLSRREQEAQEQDRIIKQNVQKVKEAALQQEVKKTRIESQLEKLKAELDKLEKSAQQKEKQASLKKEIEQLQAVVVLMKEQLSEADKEKAENIAGFEKALDLYLVRQAKTEERINQEYKNKVNELNELLMLAKKEKDEEKAQEIMTLLEQLRRQHEQEEAHRKSALENYLVQLDERQGELLKNLEEAEALKAANINAVRATLATAVQEKASRDAARVAQERAWNEAIEQQVRLQEAPLESLVINPRQNISLSRQGRQADSEVLVIPAEAPMTSAQLEATVENMEIMRRIFERKLEQADLIVKGSSAFGAAEFYVLSGLSLSRTQTKGPQSMYLQGYGALFFLNVDYPLLGPEDKVVQAAPKPERDELWDQIKKELKTPPGRLITDQSLLARSIRLREQDVVIEVEEYDEMKVEALKNTLLETLVHAGNMSHMDLDELIVIHVTGASQAVDLVATVDVKADAAVEPDKDLRQEQAAQVAVSTVGGERTGANQRRLGVSPRRVNIPSAQILELDVAADQTEAGEPTHMVIRASMDDIDKLAHEALSFEEFKKRVKIFIY